MENNPDLEMERLLKKYANGRIPPLVNLGDPSSGLIDPDLLKIYFKGVHSLYNIRLGMIMAGESIYDSRRKWETGDFSVNQTLSSPSWGLFCKTLRDHPIGNRMCEVCDRRWASKVDQEDATIAYMCDNGLIDFATPINVMGLSVAVMFSGQHKPVSGPIWNPELLYKYGRFRPLRTNEIGVEAWTESQNRIKLVEDVIQFEAGYLLEKINDEVKNKPETEVTPEQVQEICLIMDAMGKQIAALGKANLERDKSQLAAWISNKISHSLNQLSESGTNTGDAWVRLANGLDYFNHYFGFDYAMIVSCSHPREETMMLRCQAGLPESEFIIGEKQTISTQDRSRVETVLCSIREQTQISFKEFRGIEVFERLNLLARKSTHALAIPLLALTEGQDFSSPVMVVGLFSRDLDIQGLHDLDKSIFADLVKDISLTSGTISLIEQLNNTAKQQALFYQDVAHDIRNPIQIIISQAEIISAGLVSQEGSKIMAKKLATQARRLDIMSRRVWTLEDIDSGNLLIRDREWVSVYDTLMENRRLLLDIAERRDIKIIVVPDQDRNKDIQRWPAVWVNRSLFTQAVLNLLDNAIKYSYDQTEIRIFGNRTVDGCTIIFSNRGIRINEEEYNSIFRRHYRTNQAKRFRLEGTGIGLSIVKAFADKHGRVSVRSTQIGRTSAYLTNFELYIREREE